MGGKKLPTTAGERTGDNQKGMGSCVRDIGGPEVLGGGVWGNRRRHCVTMVVVDLNKAAHWRALSSRNRGGECDGRLAWVPAGRTVGDRRQWAAGGEYPPQWCTMGVSRRW
uniref:Uncharacterized protein n=1 Tax=Opuntia streptacantha TaxID=393608 RepID=A0A7C8Z1R2_OPUST